MNTSSKLFLPAALLVFSLACLGPASPAWSQGKAAPNPKAAKAQASTLPTVTIDHWRKSGSAEKHAFLLGFVSMMDLEKEWQGNRPLPMKDSLIGSWCRGLSGLTVPQISKQLDAYIAQSSPPLEPDKSIVEAMWFKFVQPTVTEKLSPEVQAKGRRLRDKAGQ